MSLRGSLVSRLQSSRAAEFSGRRPACSHVVGSLTRLCRSVSATHAATYTESAYVPSKVCQSLFGTHSFEPGKLRVAFLPPVSTAGPCLPEPRRYTLTHSDITGRLELSVGIDYNEAQLSGWYLRLIRDEVLAEWRCGKEGQAELHLFCHISGNGSAPLPARLRSRIFRREMPLVLRAIKHADRAFLTEERLMGAIVLVHLSSHIQAFNKSIMWGTLGEELSWKQPGTAWSELWQAQPGQTRPNEVAALVPAAKALVQQAADVCAESPVSLEASLTPRSQQQLDSARKALEQMIARNSTRAEGLQRSRSEQDGLSVLPAPEASGRSKELPSVSRPASVALDPQPGGTELSKR